MSGEVLKPCPFCGSPDVEMKAADEVWCGACLATMPPYGDDEVPNAAQRWNTRVPSDADRAAVVEEWQPIETLDRGSVTPDSRVLVWREVTGISVAMTAYGHTGVGSATHWMPAPAPPIRRLSTPAGEDRP